MASVKQEILEEIKACSTVFKRVNSVEYRIRCPICGDSQKNPRDSHCYIRCSDDPTEPILYHCFLCQDRKGGRVDREFLAKLHASPKIIDLLDRQQYHRVSSSVDPLKVVVGEPDMNSPQVRYIDRRLGPGFQYSDYEKFRIVWNMSGLYPVIRERRIRNILPGNVDSVSFLSSDHTSLITRSFLSDQEPHSQWRKLSLVQTEERSFYTIKSTVDLFTKDLLVVNIAEGIFDILSAYKNFNDVPNSLFIATLGADYRSAVEYAISTGFVGSNVMLRIYIDQGIDVKLLMRSLRKYKWLFKGIYIYENIRYKDIGTRIAQIELNERRV